MSQAYQPYSPPRTAVSAVDSRARFIVRTYNHLFGAIVLFTLLEIALFQTGMADVIAPALGSSWLLVLGGFMIVSWLASRVAHSAGSLFAQYLALGLFVAAEAIVFVPLLFMANRFAPGAIQSAGLVTMLGFAGLTAVAFVSRKDFSFLGCRAQVGRHCARSLLIGAGADLRLPARHLLQRCHGGVRGRCNPLRHLERPPPLPRGPLRGRGPRAVRFRRAPVLVRAANFHLVARLAPRPTPTCRGAPPFRCAAWSPNLEFRSRGLRTGSVGGKLLVIPRW